MNQRNINIINDILNLHMGERILIVHQREEYLPPKRLIDDEIPVLWPRQNVQVAQTLEMGIIANSMLSKANVELEIIVSKRVVQNESGLWKLAKSPIELSYNEVDNLDVYLSQNPAEEFDLEEARESVFVFAGRNIEPYFWVEHLKVNFKTYGPGYHPHHVDEAIIKRDLDSLGGEFADLSFIDAMELMGETASQKFYEERERRLSIEKSVLNANLATLYVASIIHPETSVKGGLIPFRLIPLVKRAIELGMHRQSTALRSYETDGLIITIPDVVSRLAKDYDIPLD